MIAVKNVSALHNFIKTFCYFVFLHKVLLVIAPNEVKFDTPEQIVQMKEKIMMRAVLTNSMPQGNVTNMTQGERDAIKAWILQGAKIQD